MDKERAGMSLKSQKAESEQQLTYTSYLHSGYVLYIHTFNAKISCCVIILKLLKKVSDPCFSNALIIIALLT